MPYTDSTGKTYASYDEYLNATTNIGTANAPLLVPQGSAASANPLGVGGGGIKLPTTTTSTPGTNEVGGMIDYWKKQFEVSQSQMKDYQEQLKTATTKQTAETKGWKDLIFGAKAPTAVREEATTTTGIKPTEYFADEQASIAELDKLNIDYNAMVAQRDTAIAQQMGVPTAAYIMSGKISRIERDYAVRLNQMSANINSKAATFEAKQNRFNEAQNYINNAVSAATADMKYNVDMYSTFYNENQDLINKLDTKYQIALQESQTAAQNAWTTAVSEKTEVGNLMIKPEYSGAGITINDTLEQAQAKVAKYVGTPAYLNRVAALGAAGRAPETQNEDFNSDMAMVSTYGNRDTALTTLNNMKTALVNKYGIDKYQQLLNEVDRIFPAPTPKVSKPPSLPAVAEAGKATKSFLKEAFAGEFSTKYIGEPVLKAGQAISSFWKGLFQ